MIEDRLRHLYNLYIEGNCSDTELKEFRSLLKQAGLDGYIEDLLDQAWEEIDANKIVALDSLKAEALFNSIVEQPQNKRNILNKSWIRIAATFAICISAALGIYISQDTKETLITQTTETVSAPSNDIMPGSNKAILTLGNGEEILLDDSENGCVATQQNVEINKLKDGQLVYFVKGAASNSSQILINKITTPIGGQYKLMLPDGTKVYLNAQSSLKYPAKFIGKERKVTLTGEAYFEVAKNTKMPFIVNVNNKQQVEVLGTHFNIMAYEDNNAINTTLVEGSVKVHTPTSQILLKPGQQAVNATGTTELEVFNANIDEAMAWKNGYFIFNNENIKAIMKKLSRWYDMDVIYQGNMSNINFLGNYSYSKSLANLLKSIEITQKVHFKIEGRRVTVIAN
ncbi:MAG: FecR family protein [Sphingobacteriaceae bacterium]